MNDSHFRNDADMRRAARAIERRFSTRFRNCRRHVSFERMWLPKKRNFPKDLLSLALAQ